ncbi:RodZ domain-containing protein [Bacillus sp. SM2101]|uniref:helix-turn-helix domain-containing protein n=1 Tax=Bacillus sp. SM2101 TaxID=2805366 RepID=UPI001BDE2055|nr:RodZ domain-containing protein [Bacillus sp. SM2101]
MTELGKRLKEAREEKNISIDDLQKLTKIQKRYLIGIEDGNYDRMPGQFYVRAFIKSYCEAVELDADLIFEQYENELPSSSNSDLPGQLSRVQSRKQISPTTTSKVADVLPKVLTGVFVFGLLIGIYFIALNFLGNSDGTPAQESGEDREIVVEDNSKENDPVEEVDSEPAAEDADQETDVQDEEVDEPEDVVEQELEVINIQGRNVSMELSNTEEFNLEIVSTGDTWVQVVNDQGEKLYSTNLNAEDQPLAYDMTDESKVVITAGFTPDTEININGEMLEFPEEAGTTQVIEILFNKQ